MKRKLVLLVALTVSMVALANPVSKEEAMSKAQAFVNGKNKQRQGGRPHRVKLAHRHAMKQVAPDNALYYVFNVGEKDGFVIVSGDDRTPDVIGYADSGSFDTENMPESMRTWMQGYADQLEWLQKHPQYSSKNQSKAPAVAKASWQQRSPIAPLIQTKWYQLEPYNNLCPKKNGEATLTGCVATAMAQIMYYHRHPEKDGNGIVFDWDNMLPTYKNGSTEEQQTAVATLMRESGKAVSMVYNTAANGGSIAASADVPRAFLNIFKYPKGVRYELRSDWRQEDWEALIYEDLAANRPVYMSGQSSSGGHAFVVDGYDSDNLFHINWGWDGRCDGYFLLSVMDPYNEGSTLPNPDSYNIYQELVYNIRPVTDGIKLLITSTGGVFKKPNGAANEVRCTFTVSSGTKDQDFFEFDYGIAYFKDGNLNTEPIYLTHATTETGQTLGAKITADFTVAGLPDGVHVLVPIYRERGTQAWIPIRKYAIKSVLTTVTVVNGEVTKIVLNKELPITFAQKLKVTDVKYLGDKIAKHEQLIKATIRNTNSLFEYYGELRLYVNGTLLASEVGMHILPDSCIEVQFAFTPSTPGTYPFEIDHTFLKSDGSRTYKILYDGVVEINAEVQNLVEAYLSDGTVEEKNAESEILLENNVCAVNLMGISGVENVTGGNENTLYFFGADDTVPASLSARNIVKAQTATNIKLQDGTDFYTPLQFTTENVTYTRTFDKGLTRNDYKNWTTIVLPFNVSSVTVEYNGTDYPLDWFRNANETKKNFWVMEFSHEENGVVYFSHANEIKAYRPYLIAVPGEEWGPANDLTNMPITFHGTNATISVPEEVAISGTTYQMTGVLAQKNLENVYVLNANGDQFVLQDTAIIDAFRAYFEPTSTAATASMLMMAFGNGNQDETTALKPVFDHGTMNQSNAIYDLQGRKLNGEPTQKGIYIVNGKKVIKK